MLSKLMIRKELGSLSLPVLEAAPCEKAEAGARQLPLPTVDGTGGLPTTASPSPGAQGVARPAHGGPEVN